MQVHAQLRGPDGRGVRGRAPPDPVAQARRVRLEAQQAGRVGEHRPRVRLGEALALEQLEEDLGVPARHVGVGLALGGLVAEVAEAVDHLLRRAAADAQLQPAAGDEVGRAGVLGHVERVLVAHVDDGGADLDASWCARRSRPAAGTARRAGGRSGGRGSRRRRRPSSSAATASSIDWSRASDADPHLRVRRLRPMPERQEPDLLHAPRWLIARRVDSRAGGPSRIRLADPRTSTQTMAAPGTLRMLREAATASAVRPGYAAAKRCGAARTISRVAAVDRRSRSREVRGRPPSTATIGRRQRSPSSPPPSAAGARRAGSRCGPPPLTRRAAAVRQHKVDHAADRSVDGHLEPCTPSRMERREQRLDHPTWICRGSAGRSPGTSEPRLRTERRRDAVKRPDVRFASPASASSNAERIDAPSGRDLADRDLALFAKVRSCSPTDRRRLCRRDAPAARSPCPPSSVLRGGRVLPEIIQIAPCLATYRLAAPATAHRRLLSESCRRASSGGHATVGSRAWTRIVRRPAHYGRPRAHR